MGEHIHVSETLRRLRIARRAAIANDNECTSAALKVVVAARQGTGCRLTKWEARALAALRDVENDAELGLVQYAPSAGGTP